GELVADADRERVVDELREHMLAGRLTAAELEQRLALAHRSRTWADLDSARAELPPSPAIAPRSIFGGDGPQSARV
ncbi:MAG: DUF1707 SHOCT-like domain-containing protein, partial [Solirubrobacteraceae bacterium]